MEDKSIFKKFISLYLEYTVANKWDIGQEGHVFVCITRKKRGSVSYFTTKMIFMYSLWIEYGKYGP